MASSQTVSSRSPSSIDRMKKELTCSVCLGLYKDPKTLPCLHAFCCPCLNHLAASRADADQPIACPDCRYEISLPQGGTFDSFPSSFYLGRLRELVPDEDQNYQAKCGTFDHEQVTATAYCFSCECFICVKCKYAHLRSKALKSHRVTSLRELQEEDVQEILRRPQLCEEENHTKEAMKHYCKPCERSICHKCAMTTHRMHELVPIEEAVSQAKVCIDEAKEDAKARASVLRDQIRISKENYRQSTEQIRETKRAVHENAKQWFEETKKREREMMGKLDAILEDERQKFENKKNLMQSYVDQLNAAADQLAELHGLKDSQP